ncbi:hypothetical protein LX32DRAFT_710447 [Colletotrichum zoysiae]|uniref:Mmc protein n=1 Tax=Colletotrichum zoysiae TaxID=1216348 RepID=A0AAD9HP45_9PEZI|nr:hypothetical protein LX32DRAFT_710447 [Colletotrichum zoysiae]
MQTQSVLAAAGLVAAAAAQAVVVNGTAPVGPAPTSGVLPPGYNGTGVYTVTTVWDVVSTYCPEPTTLYFNDRTYAIDKPTTLVIPDCPCTQTYTTRYADGYKPTTYVVPNPPVQTAAGGGAGAPGGVGGGGGGATPAAPGQKPGGTGAVVVTAGAGKPVVALLAGVLTAAAFFAL